MLIVAILVIIFVIIILFNNSKKEDFDGIVSQNVINKLFSYPRVEIKGLENIKETSKYKPYYLSIYDDQDFYKNSVLSTIPTGENTVFPVWNTSTTLRFNAERLTNPSNHW